MVMLFICRSQTETNCKQLHQTIYHWIKTNTAVTHYHNKTNQMTILYISMSTLNYSKYWTIYQQMFLNFIIHKFKRKNVVNIIFIDHLQCYTISIIIRLNHKQNHNIVLQYNICLRSSIHVVTTFRFLTTSCSRSRPCQRWWRSQEWWGKLWRYQPVLSNRSPIESAKDKNDW